LPGWTVLPLGDPADDLAWLLASPQQRFSDAVVAAYRSQRSREPDEHILRRAALAAEFALAQWLVRGRAGENQQMTDEALGLLKQLASDIDTYGGRPIALTPPETEAPQPPADVQDSKPVMRPGAAATIADTGEVDGARPTGTGSAPAEEPDDEPAVITDADAGEGPTGQVTARHPRTAPAQGSAPAHSAPADQGTADGPERPAPA